MKCKNEKCFYPRIRDMFLKEGHECYVLCTPEYERQITQLEDEKDCLIQTLSGMTKKASALEAEKVAMSNIRNCLNGKECSLEKGSWFCKINRGDKPCCPCSNWKIKGDL